MIGTLSLMLIIVITLILVSGVRVAQEYQRGVVFRLGRYVGTRGPGLYYLIPLIERGRRARIIKADAEFEASQKLAEAASVMESRPISLELRRLQMISEVGAENNSSTILMIPSDFTNLARALVSKADDAKTS